MNKDNSKTPKNSDDQDKDPDDAANGNLVGNVPTPASNQSTPTKPKKDKDS